MKGKTMRVEAANDDDNSTRGWLLGDKRRRVLDVFYTDYGTKVFVEDGVLIEEKMKSSQTKPSPSVNGMVAISDFHTPPKSPQQTLEEVAEALRSHKEQTISLANAALCHYNSKHISKRPRAVKCVEVLEEGLSILHADFDKGFTRTSHVICVVGQMVRFSSDLKTSS